MKITLYIYFLFFTLVLSAQVKILSWNLENFGKSKSDSTVTYITNTIKQYDIVAIQEVVAGYGGVQAVVSLADKLNRTGSKWDYIISNPTSSSAYKTERYAYIWKTARVKKIGDAWLEKKYHLEIDREPFYCTFEYNKKQFSIANFHAITKSKQPEREIKYFKFLPAEYPNLNLIFVGDFNCPQSHSVFNPLKKVGYKPVLFGQKTSLKKSCENNNCLSNEFDNMFYNTSKIKMMNSGIVLFYLDFDSLKQAKKVSDHIPIWAEFNLK